jgi:type IV secretory pathway component VirB8
MIFNQKTKALNDHDNEVDGQLYEQLRISNKRLWVMMLVQTMLAVLTVVALLYVAANFKKEYAVIKVDKLTGATGLAQTVEEYVKDPNLNHKNYIKKFLTSYRNYNFATVQRDYDVIKAHAGEDLWKKYSSQFEGPNSLDKKFGKKVTITPQNLAITPTGNGLATVRYELITANDDGTTISEIRNATLRYVFIPNLKLTEAEAIENPFGFKVLALDETIETKN